MKEESSFNFNAYDFVLLLVKWRKVFIVNFLLVAVLSSTIAMLLPKWYSATTVVLPPASDLGGLASMIPANLAGLAVNFGVDVQNQNIYETILGSRTIKERVIEKFNLREVYEMAPDAFQEEILDAFMTHYNASVRDDQALEITIDDRDPERAAAMANFCAKALDAIYQEQTSAMARQQRIFIERRLFEVTDSLNSLNDSLMRFQSITGAIALPEQTQAMIASAADLKAKQLSNDVQMEVLRASIGINHPMFKQAQLTSREYQSKYDQLINGKESALFIGLQELPAVARQYADLMRELKIQSALLEVIYPQYETAKIQEARETGNVQVLDPAKVPERKSKPRRTFVVLGAVAASMLFTLIGIVGIEYWRVLPVRNKEDYQKIQDALNHLRKKPTGV